MGCICYFDLRILCMNTDGKSNIKSNMYQNFSLHVEMDVIHYGNFIVMRQTLYHPRCTGIRLIENVETIETNFSAELSRNQDGMGCLHSATNWRFMSKLIVQ